MKKALIIIAILLLLIDIFLNCLRHKEQEQRVNDMYNHIDSVMRHRAHIDTLYWQHLEVCDHQLKDGIKVVEY